MTTATSRQARRALTALDPNTLVRRRPLNGGAAQIRDAVSADGVWRYHRVEMVGTPWRVEHLPSGRDTWFDSLPESRAWTADTAAAVKFLREACDLELVRSGFTGIVDVVAAGHDPQVERFALGARALAVFDGTVLAGDPAVACSCEGRVCGGYLVDTAAGWVSADTCPDCVDDHPHKRLQCRSLHRHQPCPDPDPMLCAHVRCTCPARPVTLIGCGPCRSGHELCCGCCTGY